VVWDF
jgi:energy-coupling factor transporter ATP-binding protein EcfA2